MGEPAATNVARPQQTNTYLRDSLGSTSPQQPFFRSDIFGAGGLPSFGSFNGASRPSIDRGAAMPSLSASVSDLANFGMPDARPAPAIIIRRLSRNIGSESLNSMLIFAGDLIDTEFIRSPYPDDHGFTTAVARFRSQSSALEAQQKLHGKPNTNKDGNMIVEVHSSSMASAFDRRNTVDGTSSRGQTSSTTSSNGSATGQPGRSRFGSTFHPNEKTSPPLPSSATSNGEFPIPESSAHFQNLFSPQSPIINGYENGARVSGKSMINDDSVDDETGELLKDPIAYANAKGGQQNNQQQPHHARRSTTSNTQVPLARFGSLSLGTHPGSGANNMSSPPNGAQFNGNRGMSTVQNHAGPAQINGANGNYGLNYTRPQYPPVNPADQNPPCNTLYVGNLPLDTSEDELKAVFSKQRGYKRLCFRTKQNGPMCFVEFEDVSFATKALNELYGHPLHNSVKGGIRLSFSKNPLGVRSGQANGLGPNAVMNPHAMAPGHNGVMPGANFSSVSGPPPGLGSPSGMGNAPGYRGPTGMDGMFQNPFGLQGVDFTNQLGARNNMSPTSFQPTTHSGPYGRDHRPEYSDYPTSR